MSIPAQLRLDNAANIYPASLSKHFASLYRMRITLAEAVDPTALQAALDRVSERIPTFRCGLDDGLFWWYLRRLDKRPAVTAPAPLRPFDFKDYGGHLFRISADGTGIVLDIFHALTDGGGARTFLLTLAAEYLRIRYGLAIPCGGDILDPDDAPCFAEVEDSFKTVFTGRNGRLERNDDAYQSPGTVLPGSALRDTCFELDEAAVRKACRDHGCTVTELLTTALLGALQEQYHFDPGRRRSSVVKVSVPVNLRSRYGSRSLRNFSSYVNLGTDVGERRYDFDDMLNVVRTQKRALLSPDVLEDKIAANVALEESFMVRCIPLVLKRRIIDLVNKLHGDRFFSTTLSNLGAIALPEAMQPWVRSFDFMLGRQRGNGTAAACVSCAGRLRLHLTSKIAENDLERLLLEEFEALALPVRIDSSMLA